MQNIQDKTARSINGYRKVEERMRSLIESGAWPVGMKLPGRIKLATEFGVGVATMERAVSPLISEGLLIANDRSGTRVAERRSRTELSASVTFSHGPQSPAVLPDIANATFGIITQVAPLSGDRSDDVWFSALAREVEETLSESKGETYFVNRYRAGQEPLSITESLSILLERGVNAIGIIDFHATREAENEVFSLIDISRIPVVCISLTPMHPVFPHVYYDSSYAGYQAAEHLIRQGYRDILFLAPFDFDWVNARIAGAYDAVRHAGLPPEALRVFPNERSGLPEKFEADIFDIIGCTQMRRAFEEYQFSGVIAANDGLAYGVLQAAQEIGKTAGKDFGLIGFDDLAESVGYNLTSLRPPLAAMGQEGARLLMRALRGEQIPREMRLCSKLVVRNSTRLDRPGERSPPSPSRSGRGAD